MTRLLTALMVGCFAPALLAQAAYTQLSPATSPSPRAGGVGVTDGSVLYHFGGKPGPSAELNDLWLFTGSDWIDITPTTGSLPTTRHWYAAAYDTNRSRYVLFGGRSGSANLGDTWEYDGAMWTQLTPAIAPSPRRWASMAYDPNANAGNGACILFGGEDGGVYNNETWSWDGAAWTLLTPTTSPMLSERGRGKLSYDPTRGEMVYFGGRAATVFSDTWVWDGATWTETMTANAPSSLGIAGRFAYGMTYDIVRDRHVLFGGTRNGPTLGDTWEFDGTDWEMRSATSPGDRTGPTFAFVPAFGKTILFGGFSSTQLVDTWEYQTAALPSVVSYGAGCTGPGGPLSLVSSSSPWADDTWTASCGNLGPTSLGLAVWGTATGPIPLNPVLPMAPLGCDLLNTADLLTGAIVPSSGQVSTMLPIADDPSLAGAMLSLQVAELEFDLGGTWVGLYTSNGLTITVGVR